ncbi:MAG TPA: dihydroorotate dehydrogenase electron transfer subunit [Dermatophilaceae bacterium]|nr:dihydroorotate dehydrogenase electron transfer subunit [Dermatophilaceae bacterium]
MTVATRVPQQRAELLATERIGAYHRLRFGAPDVAARALPGQFVAAAVGGPLSAHLLRRCFSLHRAEGGGVEVVVAPRGPGTRWLTELPVGGVVDLVGPLGTPFPLAQPGAPCVLVGGGYGSAPLFWLADQLRRRGCPVRLVLGAASADRLFGIDLAAEVAEDVRVTTDDGSLGTQGWVSDVLPGLTTRDTVVYACGPMAMLRAVTGIATAAGAVAHVAVEESMACGVGICMTCVLPVRSEGGVTRMVRSCVEGPVFRGDRVRWDAFENGWCRVPADAVGAPGQATRADAQP